jgi:hypothetical protein
LAMNNMQMLFNLGEVLSEVQKYIFLQWNKNFKINNYLATKCWIWKSTIIFKICFTFYHQTFPYLKLATWWHDVLTNNSIDIFWSNENYLFYNLLYVVM